MMSTMSMSDNISSHKIACALGSNAGSRLEALHAAIEAMKAYVAIEAVSPVYETAAVYITDQPSFLNAAFVGTTALEPVALLYTVKEIERVVGRLPTYRYGPRVIDIDILFYDQLSLSSSELTIPHSLMHERAFVLRPLADIAAQWRHPLVGKTVQEMLDELPETAMERVADVA